MIALTGTELIILWIILILFLVTGGIVAFILIHRWKYPFKYICFENIAGVGYVPTRRGRARLISFGDGGEEIFFLKNIKKWRVAYGKRIGKNQIAWAVGDDGYWYNITFGNIDKKLMELGVIPVDKDMRYAYASSRKGIENRYNDKTFMDKYGTIISFFMLFLCIVAMGGFMYFTTGKIVSANAENKQTAEVQKEVMMLAKQVLASIDNIKAGGSGMVTENVPVG